MEKELFFIPGPLCELHDGFFSNAFYIQDDEFQGFLSKRMNLELAEGTCTCAIDNLPVDPSMEMDCMSPSCFLGGIEDDPLPSLALDMPETTVLKEDPCPSMSESSTCEEAEMLTPTSTPSPAPSSASGMSESTANTSEYAPSEAESEADCQIFTPKIPAPVLRRHQPTEKHLQAVEEDNLNDIRFRTRLPSCAPSETPQSPSPVRPQPAQKVHRVRKNKKKSPDQCKHEGIIRQAIESSPSLPIEGIKNSKNKFLVEKRRQGLTYSEIKILGNFSEAESTLRGRYRTLTKEKEDRVRKPTWTSEDLYLLPLAVKKACDKDPKQGNIPWEKVANNLFNLGGSYKFGSGACHKAWNNLVRNKKV